EPAPLCIGLMPPRLTPTSGLSRGAANQWQAQIAEELERCNIGSRVVRLNPDDPKAAHKDDCDIIVQPMVQVPKIGDLSNSSNAFLANLAWLTTYVGYFFFADMEVEAQGKLDFQVVGYRESPAFITNEKVSIPETNMTFGERDQVFSPRFFMSLLLFPAMHPTVCRMLGVQQADPTEVAQEVQHRMSVALAEAIAKFVNGQLTTQQEKNGLPYLITSSLRVARLDKRYRMTVVLHTPTTQAPSALMLVLDSKGAVIESPEGRLSEQKAGSDSRTREYEFQFSPPPNDAGAMRLIFDEPAGGQVAYTVTKAHLLQLATSPQTATRK
ncbi:MAG TPA: hypothetical protein VK843_20775, partial [Planctomycetota bacterium]|nr:hypothetical protein [Planctomycetota bacterium]